ncbi:hypothetical protein [Eggerthella guodeyinii]|uniref:Uncharacterized protein n=1 Tax=Eggerthella guodeyinii TaxID=2690837 RepID=A0A6N7RQP1_9ACTN|nr:hypothetical protein [Eggerthella guodeyinii]MRX83332.1 hypothetical protein [Eggerthella guodeyinii]
MLFLLTGDVQIGKTRWLGALADELASEGVAVAGVLAPGVWRECGPHEASGERGLAGEGRFEKLGIDNVLLPAGERVAFARRRDLALAEGSFDPTSQSAAAQLAWEISDDAIARVNAHFDALARGDALRTHPENPAHPENPENPADPARMFHVKHSFAQTDVSRETSRAGETSAGLLVVDELGRLELMRDGGLTAATALLERGPASGFPHALAVVRDWLCPCAEERFAAAWGGAEVLAPDERARALVRAACGLSA